MPMLYLKGLVSLDSAGAVVVLAHRIRWKKRYLGEIASRAVGRASDGKHGIHHYWRAWAYLVHRESQFRCDVLLTFRATFLLVLKPFLLP
jgi:hypothetical protein